MINLLTVKVGNKYNSQHVNRLVKSFKTAHEFKAYCITDDPTGLDANIQAIQPSLKVPGWWNKIQLFSPDMPRGQNIYLDLDMVLLSDFDFYFDFPSHFSDALFTTKDPYNWQGCGLNSSVMIWRTPHCKIYTEFAKDPYKHIQDCPGGDQQFISRLVDPWYFLSGEILSYKKDIEANNYRIYKDLGVELKSRAINFHGHPKPDDILNDPQHPFYEQLKAIW